jgi:hypothetical protein
MTPAVDLIHARSPEENVNGQLQIETSFLRQSKRKYVDVHREKFWCIY